MQRAMEPLGVWLYQGKTKSSLHLLRQLLLPWLRWSKTAVSIVPMSPPSGYQGPQGFVWGSTLFNLLLKSVLIFITAFCMKAVQTVGLGTVIMWRYWILHENLWRKRKFCVLLLILWITPKSKYCCPVYPVLSMHYISQPK